MSTCGQVGLAASGGAARRHAVRRPGAACGDRPRAGAAAAVLLADEPVASLDPEAAQEIMRLLRRLAHHDGLAVLCVLHQVDLAFAYADRVVGMRDGRAIVRPIDAPACRKPRCRISIEQGSMSGLSIQRTATFGRGSRPFRLDAMPGIGGDRAAQRRSSSSDSRSSCSR